ncbi:PREDICTED: pentatricopeptide repeat-containing protein At2g37320 [Theobroma cacao]|uniref:Pentatricopeptide repeat-containing protein At2g37320 n=1 Tax=Theobroma cacao TaxID=3641 RepID=A0AB32V393_THECC|nr:PREDICTED: pentatricopeptide repeat-containing protein At2g37320 [Theobroma cacao]
MNTLLLKSIIQRNSCFKPLLFFLSQSIPFSSYKLKLNPPSKVLRIMDIMSPKPTPTPRQNHLRLIQDFLQSDSDQFTAQHFVNDFVYSDSPTEYLPIFFNEILAPPVTNKDISKFNPIVLSNAISSCGSKRNLYGGIQYHCLAIKTGFFPNVYVGSSLVTSYGKCGELEEAYKVFDEMPVKNVVSWTTIIAGFAQEWQIDMCLELYNMMKNLTLKPNDFTLTSLLRACTGSGALGQGRSAHCQVIQMGFDSYSYICNALISMYCKCGSVEDAMFIFKKMAGNKDIVSWNSMIAGYAQHGLAMEAIDLFEKMKEEKIKPDSITFLGVLSSCRHAGLVEQGRVYFDSMVVHGVEPALDHYSCVVDLLGRAGLLKEAREFILKMPICPNAVIWGSLLSSCRLHGIIWVGIEAAESRLLLEPGCAATHVQLANLYASARRWDQAARVRKLMKDKGLKTSPGYSWIEVKNEVYRFRAEDKSNSKVTEIHGVLGRLVNHMRTLDYGQQMHEEEVDDALCSTI